MKKKLSPAPLVRSEVAHARGLESARVSTSILPTAALLGALLFALGSAGCAAPTKGGDDLDITADHGRKPAVTAEATAATTPAAPTTSTITGPGTGEPIDPVATISVKGEAPAVMPVATATAVASIAPHPLPPMPAGKIKVTTPTPVPHPPPLGGKPSNVSPKASSGPCALPFAMDTN